MVTKVVGGIAGVVFLFCPLRSGVQVLINAGSLVVALICGAVHYNLDDNNDNRNTGYWPQAPGNSPLYRDPHSPEQQLASTTPPDASSRA
jgi:hypothetical protein